MILRFRSSFEVRTREGGGGTAFDRLERLREREMEEGRGGEGRQRRKADRRTESERAAAAIHPHFCQVRVIEGQVCGSDSSQLYYIGHLLFHLLQP